MKQASIPVIRIILAAIGIALLLFAVTVSNSTYAHVLRGDANFDLSWGPTLFRVLSSFHGAFLILIAVTLAAPSATVTGNSSTDANPKKLVLPVIGTLVILSAIAIGLRLWNLNTDLWIDEVLTLLDFVRKPFGEMLTSFPSKNQHMLYSILAHASTSWFGESPWAIRLPSVLFGVGSIWAFFFLCRHLLGTLEALLGSALMTVSYHHVWFSQNARGYTGLLMFTMLATWAWSRALRFNEWSWWGIYGVSIVLGMWVHPTMAFVVASHGILHLLFLAATALSGDGSGSSPERTAGLRPFITWALSVTVTLQLYALALPEFLAVGLHEESGDSEWTNPIWIITESIQGLSVGFAGLAVVLIGGAFVAFGWFSLFKSDRRAGLAMVIPAVLSGATMLALGHNLWPRFFFFCMGFGLLIVINGAIQLPKVLMQNIRTLRDRSRLSSGIGISFAFVLIIASLITVPKNYALPKQDFSGAKEFVEQRSESGDEIVAVRLAGVVYGSYLRPYWPVITTDDELASLQTSSDRKIWLVYTLPIEIRAFRPELWNAIERDYEVVKVFPGTLNGGEIYVCQKRQNR